MTSKIAGDHSGRDAVFAMFGHVLMATEGTIAHEIRHVFADDDPGRDLPSDGPPRRPVLPPHRCGSGGLGVRDAGNRRSPAWFAHPRTLRRRPAAGLGTDPERE